MKILSPEDNSYVYFPSQILSMFPKEYEKYAFNLDSDFLEIDKLKKCEIEFENLHVRLQNLCNTHCQKRLNCNYQQDIVNSSDTLDELLMKMSELNTLRDKFSADFSLEHLISILNFPSDVLHKQQIAEVIIETFQKCDCDNRSPLKQQINQAVATAFGLFQEPWAGLEKFLFRPLDPKIKEAIMLLQKNSNSSSEKRKNENSKNSTTQKKLK